MTLAVMQPYFFPYIGYWQLLYAADTFVIYDDVNYFKKGYINRNSILNEGNVQRINLELMGASQNKLINEIEVRNNSKKLIKNIEHAYKKAPQYEKVFPLIKMILLNTEKNLAKFLGDSIKKISDYLEIDINILYSSDIEKDSEFKGKDKILDICQRLDASHYINAIGGQDLYSEEAFRIKGLELSFVETELKGYKQFNYEFVPYLSIIDVMMFNSKKEIQKMLSSYKLIRNI